jgi:pimeloyl-ACP methyl ester carboxylesterase
MPAAILDGISTRYEVAGSGPPLLMYSPGGFDATLEKWSAIGVYAKIKILDHLTKAYTCIMFDRRETGASGGRVERFGWHDFAVQGKALLDHLGIAKAGVLGGCMGVPCALAFAVAYPESTQSLTLIWPVGGAAYRMNSHLRFAQHLAFVQQEGLAAVVELAQREGKHFGADPRGGPWASVLKHDRAFADAYLKLDVARYSALVAGIARTMYDRDTAPGAEPEDLMNLDLPALVIPGADAAHATSAARYLGECLPRADYWDVAPADQTEANAPARIMEFLAAAQAG